MKNLLLLVLLALIPAAGWAQAVLLHNDGTSLTLGPDAQLTLQGGAQFNPGSTLTVGGTLRVQDNGAALDWRDNTAAGLAVGGTGRVIFASNRVVNTFGTTQFYDLEVANPSQATLASNKVMLNADVRVAHALTLTSGAVETGSNRLILTNPQASSLIAGAGNAGFSQSFLTGTLRRYVAPNADTYTFPVGDAAQLQPRRVDLLNNGLAGVQYLDVRFGPKAGNDAGLSAGAGTGELLYFIVNPAGVWTLSPDAAPSGGTYGLQLYLAGFQSLLDNLFGPLRRPGGSANAADWQVPAGSVIPAVDQPGRTVASGYAQRSGLTEFGQFGIGQGVPGRVGKAREASGKPSNRLAEPSSSENQAPFGRVFPNPTERELTLELPRYQEVPRLLRIAVLASDGRPVLEQPMEVQPGIDILNLNLEILPAGLYLLRVQDADTGVTLYRQKVLKR